VVLCQFMESIEFFYVWVLRKGVQDGDWVEFDFLAFMLFFVVVVVEYEISTNLTKPSCCIKLN